MADLDEQKKSRRDSIILLAKSFETIKEFRNAHPSLYSYAHRHKFTEQAFSHMRRIRVTQSQYSRGRHCNSCLVKQPIENFLMVGRGETRRRATCITCHNKESKKWRENNLEKARENVSRSAKNNPETSREMKRRARIRSPEAFAARDMLKRIMRQTGERKASRTSEMLGYSSKELREHIESQFSTGMSWENWGEWHIDHIIPVSVMVKAGEKDPAVINALVNLQPMWA